MLYYLIVCRSLTYAQRTAAALERAGITAHILRSPKSIAGEGCSHSVKLSQRRLAAAEYQQILGIQHRLGLAVGGHFPQILPFQIVGGNTTAP